MAGAAQRKRAHFRIERRRRQRTEQVADEVKGSEQPGGSQAKLQVAREGRERDPIGDARNANIQTNCESRRPAGRMRNSAPPQRQRSLLGRPAPGSDFRSSPQSGRRTRIRQQIDRNPTGNGSYRLENCDLGQSGQSNSQADSSRGATPKRPGN